MKCCGAEHDSTAFKRSSFYKMLDNNWKSLKEKGFYLIGDSAYSIRSFLITPFDNAMHRTAEDNFNGMIRANLTGKVYQTRTFGTKCTREYINLKICEINRSSNRSLAQLVTPYPLWRRSLLTWSHLRWELLWHFLVGLGMYAYVKNVPVQVKLRSYRTIQWNNRTTSKFDDNTINQDKVVPTV